MLSDLQERYRELKTEVKNDETAFEMTLDSIGDIAQIVLEVASPSHSPERQVLTSFSWSNLPHSDFAGAILHNGKFVYLSINYLLTPTSPKITAC